MNNQLSAFFDILDNPYYTLNYEMVSLDFLQFLR